MTTSLGRPKHHKVVSCCFYECSVVFLRNLPLAVIPLKLYNASVDHIVGITCHFIVILTYLIHNLFLSWSCTSNHFNYIYILSRTVSWRHQKVFFLWFKWKKVFKIFRYWWCWWLTIETASLTMQKLSNL